MKAVILAAGRGVRMRPLTDNIPKAMVKLKGKPLLEWNMEILKECGIGEILIVDGYKREAIEKYFGKAYKGIPVRYLFQERQLGTADAIRLAEKFAEGDFLALSADVIVEKSLVEELSREDAFDIYDAVVVGRKVEDPWRYGVLSYEGEELKEIVEKPLPGKEPSDVANAGIYRFNRKIFGAIKMTEKSERGEYEITDSIKIMLEAGAKIRAFIYSGKCIDIGSKEDLDKAERDLTFK